MKLHWPSKTVLTYAAMALPGTLMPGSSGMSLANQYWTLGWPIPVDVTLYGPGSGYHGMSVPFLPIMLVSFFLWFAIARVSLRYWRTEQTNFPNLPGTLIAATMCTLWFALCTCFVAGTARFLLEWCLLLLDFRHGMRVMESALCVYPFVCVVLFAVPFVLQLIASRRYARWHKLVFCCVPILFLTILSSPLRTKIPDMLQARLCLILYPVEWCGEYYETNLESLDSAYRYWVDSKTRSKHSHETPRTE